MHESPASSSRWLLPLSAIAAVVLLFATRILGPSDLWGQTQPRTIAYTADMLSRGGEAWFLALDAEGIRATKPPLYNWLAAPLVSLIGRESEFAHKLPSLLLTLVGVWLLVRWGERFGRGVGWLAALAWVAMYPTFKLGYLARPDMLLCVVLLLGWKFATDILIDERRLRPSSLLRVAGFWLMVALAAWTKGPVAATLPAYVIAGSVLLTSSLRTCLRFRPFTFGVAGSVLALSWYGIAAWLEPEHFKQTLIYGEVVGRITGNGPEGGSGGPIMILLGLPVMWLYFLARFIPWSVPAILGAIMLARRTNEGPRRWRSSDLTLTLWGATIWCVLLIVLFSLSSGKRADYIAPVYAPASLIAAWWLLHAVQSPVRLRPWVATLAGLATLTVHAVVDGRGSVIPRSTMNILSSIVDRTNEAKEAFAHPLTPPVTPPPTLVLAPQLPHVTVLCSDVAPSANTPAAVRRALAESGRALVLVGTKRLPDLIAAAVDAGRAERLWTVEIPDDAKRADVTYDISLYLIEGIPSETTAEPAN